QAGAVEAPERERQLPRYPAIRQVVEHDAAGDVDRVSDRLTTAHAHDHTAWEDAVAEEPSEAVRFSRKGRLASARASAAHARSASSSVVPEPTLQRVAVTPRQGSSG